MTTTDLNQTALITGAGRGIGRAIAVKLSAAGYRLWITDCLEDELSETQRLLGDECDVTADVLDLRDRTAVNIWTERLRADGAPIGALILNAGVGGPDPNDDHKALEHFEHVMDVNAGAVMRCVRDLSPLIPQDGSGRVVMIASILGRMGVAGFASYCTSKSATIGLMRAVAQDLAGDQITVNAVCPGWTETQMAAEGVAAIAAAMHNTPEEQKRLIENELPLGRMVDPGEIAGLVNWLCGPESGSMTGQTLTVSSGDL